MSKRELGNQKKENSKVVESLPRGEKIEEFTQSCGHHDMSNGNYIWMCYDCRKFSCTKCYSQSHKNCYADLVENLHSQFKSNGELNLASMKEIKEEFQKEVDSMEKRYEYFQENNPFEMNIRLVNKIYDDIINYVNQRREETLKKMSTLRTITLRTSSRI